MQLTLFVRPVLMFAVTFLIFFALLTSIPFNYLGVSDQPKGTAIRLNYLRLSKNAFVVVQTLDPRTNLPDKGGYLNNPSLMPRGIYKNIDLFLANSMENVPDKVAVTIYEDTNSNDEFDQYYDSGDDSIVVVSDSPLFSKINGKIFRKIITLK